MAVIVCPSCSTKYRISDAQLSKASRMRCKKCDAFFRVQEHIEAQESEDIGRSAKHTPNSRLPSHDLSDLQLEQPTPQGSESSESQEDLSLDVNLGDITLDFGTENDALQDNIEIGEKISFAESDGNEPSLSSAMTQSLDFAFSASIPEVEDEGEQEEDDRLEEFLPSTEMDAQKISLDELASDRASENQTMTAPEDRSKEEFSHDYEPADRVGTDQQEVLPVCCIDSLAMGLSRCEICGRNLAGKDPVVAQELKQQRKQQLKSELIQAEVQVGFSEEQAISGTELEQGPAEDFSDVERALDALADGSFHEAIRKQEAKKTLTRTLQLLGGAVVVLGLLVGVIIWFLLPSSHEKLVSRYEKLMAHQEPDSRELVALFFDAAIEKDLEIFRQLSIMRTIPNITYGKVLRVGEEYGKISIGKLGETMVILQAEIASLGEKRQEKEKVLNEYMAKNLSPNLIQESLNSLTEKLNALQLAFDSKETESKRKLVGLQRDLEAIEQRLKDDQEKIQKYIDATDEQLKAVYIASVRNQKTLSEKKGKLIIQIQQEDREHRQRMKDLTIEYEPRFSYLQERLNAERERLEEAMLLQDDQKSPVTLLPREIEQLTKTITEKQDQLQENERQFQEALKFFTDTNEKSQITKNQANAEFISVNKDVTASIKIGGSTEQQVSIVLIRYRVIVADKTFDSVWFVENIAK